MPTPLLQVCVNGAHTPADHAAVPVTPQEIAVAAAACGEAGAGAVHLHAKDAEGHDSLLVEHVDAAVAAVREMTPGMPVGVTTGAWAMPDVRDRVAAISSWTQLPDFASVNWHEPGADVVAAVLLDRGIGVEAGLWGVDVVHLWARSPLRERCLRVLVEVQDVGRAAARAASAEMVTAVRQVDPLADVLLHSEGSAAWATVALAYSQNLATRVGLEDMLVRPDDTPAEDNTQLVRDATTLFGP